MTETRRVKMTKRMIKDTFLELLEKLPIEKITVSNICKNADVNRSTFYVYYDSVYQLLQEIENDVLEQVPVPSSPPLLENKSNEFLELIVLFFDYIRSNERLFRILIIQTNSTDFNQRLIETVFVKYLKNSIIKDTVFARYSYVYCINGAIGMLKQWIEDGFVISNREFAKMALNMSIEANKVYLRGN